MENIEKLLQMGEEARRAGEHEKAMEYRLQAYKEAADEDDQSDMKKAEMAFLGTVSTPEKTTRAFQWLKQFCDKNAENHNDIKQELFLLGRLYRFGIGTKPDFSKAFELFQQVAELGNYNAMFAVSEMYRDGHGIEADMEKSVEWSEKAMKTAMETAKQRCLRNHQEALEAEEAYRREMEKQLNEQ